MYIRPTWLGVGDAVSKELREHPEVLKDMYQNWPWFTTLIDLLEMVRNSAWQTVFPKLRKPIYVLVR